MRNDFRKEPKNLEKKKNYQAMLALHERHKGAKAQRQKGEACTYPRNLYLRGSVLSRGKKQKAIGLRASPALAGHVVLTLLLTLLLVPPAGAVDCPAYQHKRSDRVPIVKDMVNPTPLPGDFELPMPCGAKLILRLVCIPAVYLFDDLQLELGCTDCGRARESFMDARHRAALAGALRLEDLPSAWQEKAVAAAEGGGVCPLPGDGTIGSLYYFIGKYEISNYQWQVVMQRDCPGWDATYTAEDPRPRTDVSWFEAVDFTRRYTEWLLKNRPGALPRLADGRRAFIRLPTESEWEYAARGGQQVDAGYIDQEAFFPLQDRPLSDYAIFTETGAAKSPEKLAWIGTRCANPLGIFDTAGNAAEMTLDLFRFSVDARLHGAAGGFVIKGGSFRKHRPEIMPGRREEMPFFIDQGSYRSRDLGFRVVLAAIVTPASRADLLRKQWAALHPAAAAAGASTEAAVTPDALVADLEKLGQGAGPDREKVSLLRDYIRKTAGLQTEKEAEAARALIWKALFTAESIVTATSRCRQLRNELDMLGGIEKEKLPESEFESLKENIADLNRRLSDCAALTDQLTTAYFSDLEEIRKAPEALVQRQMALVSGSLAAYQGVGPEPARRLAQLKSHLALLATAPQTVSVEKILRDLEYKGDEYKGDDH